MTRPVSPLMLSRLGNRAPVAGPMSNAKGNIANRPYASIVYRLSAHGFTGRLTLTANARTYWIRFNSGQIVDAHSPELADSLTKMAAKTAIANKTQLAAFVAAKRKSPDTPDATLLQEVAKLTAEQIAALNRHRVAQSAARTFALPGADFECTADQPDSSAGVITAEWVILYGLRRHYDQQRLLTELGDLAGKRVRLGPGFSDRAAMFAFDDSCRPVIDALEGQDYRSLKEIVEVLASVDRRLLLAIVYAIHACDLLSIEGQEPAPAPEASAPEASAPKAATPEPSPVAPPDPDPAKAVAQEADSGAGEPNTRITTELRDSDILGMELLVPDVPDVQARQAPPPVPAGEAPPTATSDKGAKRVKVRRNPKKSAQELTEIISDRLEALDGGADHFELLGITRGAASAELQSAYFSLAKNLHPDRARATGVEIPAPDIERLFATVNKAFTTLSDPKKRSHYLEVLAAGGELAYRKAQDEAEAKAMKIIQAEEHFLAGEMSLRRKDYKNALGFFEKALTGNPEEGEHHAFYAWALWLSTADKDSVFEDVLDTLVRGAEKSPKSAAIRFFLGEISNQRGDHQAAAEHYQDTLKLNPSHSEAKLQLRLLKSRGLV